MLHIIDDIFPMNDNVSVPIKAFLFVMKTKSMQEFVGDYLNNLLDNRPWKNKIFRFNLVHLANFEIKETVTN